MNEEELQGRINGLSMAVEIALIQTLSLRYGETEKAVQVATAELEGLIEDIGRGGPVSDFRTGTTDSLRLIVDRLQGIFSSG